MRVVKNVPGDSSRSGASKSVTNDMARPSFSFPP
jgi:hypothetical protein